MNMSNNFDADVASASSKRRKTSPEGEEVVLNLAHLPNDQLVTIADYLPNTMRVMFAVALTASPKSWCATNWKGRPNEASKAIIHLPSQ